MGRRGERGGWSCGGSMGESETMRLLRSQIVPLIVLPVPAELQVLAAEAAQQAAYSLYGGRYDATVGAEGSSSSDEASEGGRWRRLGLPVELKFDREGEHESSSSEDEGVRESWLPSHCLPAVCCT